MRDSTHFFIPRNRPVVISNASVYNRKSLDTNSKIPLVNSLNHLTYLISNSPKVRETVANDGALKRLISILRNCHFSVHETMDERNDRINRHTMARETWQRRQHVLLAWEWTLAFQCLVLTGTRGSEETRQKVVEAGILPLLATVLDNYLIYHMHYDFVKKEYLSVHFVTLETELIYDRIKRIKFGTYNKTYEEYVQYLFGNDIFNGIEHEQNLFDEDFLSSTMTQPSDFGEVWQDPTVDDQTWNEENTFLDLPTSYEPVSIKFPRRFYLGKIVPTHDDLVWSLQLLAFISKYPYMKSKLQKCELIPSLSFRPILERGQYLLNGMDAEDVDVPVFHKNCTSKTGEPFLHVAKSSTMKDSFTIELEAIASKCNDLRLKKMELRDPYERLNVTLPKVKDNKRRTKAQRLTEHFNSNSSYNAMSEELTDNTWQHIISKNYLNIFQLVERFTSSNGQKTNPREFVYWSSVIMRNSCRKNETGVRQCANVSCGKWEEYPKQFSKCHRCRRTKYCSKQCQVNSWEYHRYWCHPANSTSSHSSSTTSITENQSQISTGNAINTNVSTLEGPTASDNSVMWESGDGPLITATNEDTMVELNDSGLREEGDGVSADDY
ncbi:MYND-type zinc finger protein MUB1 NDAI_0H02310 [Naumovozyma dairenensis CBS 421]|uniref:MYND-type domain-containing protein n=1 Tax=Naumovozyma dairenensis (strain ATCC 10597 / BCRC 20456 / CBS 421 / NBRC 0211 / NRRL Y-12639) TaxID=1071378 RepID=G0WF44_NAUDC|nr:hypothetical protein NDAI_0H02310 [Naumovozyma dairenensis CBS 421]CCD26405.1 hypothetical protein NDAI_0H02310 [Naumovozyma dairenensis CBS 421]